VAMTATHCNTLQHTATHCNTLQVYRARLREGGQEVAVKVQRPLASSLIACDLFLLRLVCCSVLQCVAVCCSALPCVAVCCSALQCVAVCCSMLQCLTPLLLLISFPCTWCIADFRGLLHWVSVSCSFVAFDCFLCLLSCIVDKCSSVLQCVAVFLLMLQWPALRLLATSLACVYVSGCLSVCLSVCLSFCLSGCLSAYLSVYFSVCLSMFWFVCLSLSFFLSFFLSVYLSVCLSVRLSVCLSVYLSVCLFASPPPFFHSSNFSLHTCFFQ